MPVPDERHTAFLREALKLAASAAARGEVPIGAVLVGADGRVLGAAANATVTAQDPTAHAEVLALRAAARQVGNYRLPGTTLYVTVEPCLMCVGAILNARVGTLVYGTAEPKFGAVRSLLDVSKLGFNHQFEVVAGILEDECRRPLLEFFRARRERAELREPPAPVE